MARRCVVGGIFTHWVRGVVSDSVFWRRLSRQSRVADELFQWRIRFALRHHANGTVQPSARKWPPAAGLSAAPLGG